MRNLLISAVLFALAGCSDPKAATETNFKLAMQTYLDTAYPRCYFSSNFPAEKGVWDADGRNAALEALAKVGLLSIKEVQQAEKQLFSQQTRMVTKVSYHLTADGKKYYNADAKKNYRGETIGAICAGKATVKSIGQFTEPAEMLGHKISRVNYEYTVTDMPAWAMSPELQQTIGSLKTDAQSPSTPIKGVAAMVLTNNGWVHEAMFSR